MNTHNEQPTFPPRIISVRDFPGYCKQIIAYIQSKWNSVLPIIYQDCIEHSLNTTSPLPQWYVLEKENQLIGCAGLITNDFISRMDLMPWICALYIDEEHREKGYASLLLQQATKDAYQAGYEQIYLSTDHRGFYEKKGFQYIGQGYHPWGDDSRIYGKPTNMDALIPLIPPAHSFANLCHNHQTFIIRTEQEKEYPEIYSFIQTAFETAAVKDGDEQDFTNQLRESGNYLPELAFVARKGEELIGHIMLTKMDVEYEDNQTLNALMIAPLSVKLFYRDKGVGSALVKESLRRAYDQGYGAVFLCGDPNYYYRFGFKPIATYGIENSGTVPAPYVMGCELIPGILNKKEKGKVNF